MIRYETYLSCSKSLSLSFVAFSFQNSSESCTGVHDKWPEINSELYSSYVLDVERKS